MPPNLSIALSVLLLIESISVPVTTLVIIALNILLLVGLLVWIPYSIDHKVLTLRKLGIAALASIAWAIGSSFALLFTSDQWDYLYGYFMNYDGISYFIEAEGATGYLSLALVGILAPLFGFLTLYLLSRYRLQNSPQPPTS